LKISRFIKPFPLPFLLFILLLTGCRELVRDEFPDLTPVPVMNSFLVADSLVRVHVSFTGKLDTVPLTVVDDAKVSLFVNDSATGELTPAGDGYYTSPVRVKSGNIYRIHAAVKGYPELMATDTIPFQVRLTKIEHIRAAGVDEEGYTFPSLRITFPVDPARIQYFQVSIKVKTYDDKWRAGYFKDFSDPILLAEGLPIAVFSTMKIKDRICTMNFDYTTGEFQGSGGTLNMKLRPLIVEFRSISRNYYEYLRQLYLYETGRYPEFRFGPFRTFPLYSNVTNGMGIIAGYSLYQSEIINPGE